MPDSTLPDPAIAERVVEAAERLDEGGAGKVQAAFDLYAASNAWRDAIGSDDLAASARLALAYSRRIAELEGAARHFAACGCGRGRPCRLGSFVLARVPAEVAERVWRCEVRVEATAFDTEADALAQIVEWSR